MIEIFLNKALKIHGNKYDYSRVKYVNNKTKVLIICPIHGQFTQSPDKHINSKQGCPKCQGFNKTTEEIITQFKKVHGDKYDYSKVNYVNNRTQIIVACKLHGDFTTIPKDHLSGNGCAKCVGKNKTTEEVVSELKKIHNNKYDYSKVKYINQSNKLTLICKKHGEFYQTFNTHKKGHGCPKCVGRLKSTEEFINECRIIHGDKYNYSLVEYKKSTEKITIECHIHGVFNQNPTDHLGGNGCPNCKGATITEKKTRTREEFIKECYITHGNKYDYSLVEYKNCKDAIKIICKEHGVFIQQADSHIRGTNCPKCAFKFDKSFDLLKNFIESLNINFIEKDRTVLNGLELDIFLPNHNIAIEYNGLYWHNELNIPTGYHLKKTILCSKKDIKLIHIFEDEWIHTPDIVKSRLKNILGKTENKIYARKCTIKDVPNETTKTFLNNNHLQGYVTSSIKLGLYYNNELVSLMTFTKNKEEWILSRFVNKKFTSVVGGASKLLKYFIKVYQPLKIVSYADVRWSTGHLYDELGFQKMKTNLPSYWYVKGDKRVHKSNFRKKILKVQGFDVDFKTEHQIMLERKIYRIYDCGTITYELSF